MDEHQSDKATIIIVGSIALIIGFLVGWVANGGNTVEEEPREDEKQEQSAEEAENKSDAEEKTGTPVVETTTSDLGSMLGAGDIAIADQTAGSRVVVGSVTTTATTWVGIREEHNGAVGNILGVRRVAAGENKDVAIDLLRPTTAGKRYFVVLFADNGDKQFDFKTDAKVLDAEGKLIAATFLAK